MENMSRRARMLRCDDSRPVPDSNGQDIPACWLSSMGGGAFGTEEAVGNATVVFKSKDAFMILIPSVG